jgi:metal-responsive CopG/Arc/MetJ family transcriptional regulator
MPASDTMLPMKIGVSLPDHLLAFADEEAQRRGTTRSGLLARLLEAEQIQTQVRRYIDKHGWDVADDEERWKQYQQARMAEEYRDDDW